MTNDSSKVSVLVVDQLELVCKGMKGLFLDSNLSVCGTAFTGKAALEWLENNQADVVLMDVSLPEMDGIDTMRAIKKQYPEQLVIGHSLLDEIEYINSMLVEGARGYILKEASLEEIETAVETVRSGKVYLSPKAQEVVDKGYQYTDKRPDGEYMGLSKREREIIRLIALEKTNKEIADELFLSIETIRTYRKSLMSKLNVKSAAGLVKYAVDRRWV